MVLFKNVSEPQRLALCYPAPLLLSPVSPQSMPWVTHVNTQPPSQALLWGSQAPAIRGHVLFSGLEIGVLGSEGGSFQLWRSLKLRFTQSHSAWWPTSHSQPECTRGGSEAWWSMWCKCQGPRYQDPGLPLWFTSLCAPRSSFLLGKAPSCLYYSRDLVSELHPLPSVLE